MKKLQFIVSALFLLMMTTNLEAQNRRILDEMFTNVNVTYGVQYGQNHTVIGFTGTPPLPVDTNMKMDIYQPVGDTASNRPLIILMHAGSFLPPAATGLPLGTRGDSVLVELATRFAKRGWVAVSMSYRLGWNPLAPSQFDRAKGIVVAVYRAMQDSKNAVRYFKQDASTTNTYKIDTAKIVLGGSNSGAYVALAASSLNDTSELTNIKFVDSLGAPFINQSLWGDFDGFGGTPGFNMVNIPGYSSNFQMVLNLGGAVGDTTWIEAGEKPIISFHGVQDAGTPIETGVVIVAATGQPVVEVSGSHDITKRSIVLSNQAGTEGTNFDPAPASVDGNVYGGLYPFYGQGFEPWGWYSTATPVNPTASKTKALAYIDTIVNYFSPRAYKKLIDPNYQGEVGIFERERNNMSVYIAPNPANSSFTVKVSDNSNPVSEIKLTDIAGRTVKSINADHPNNLVIHRDGLNAGVYLISIRLKNGEQGFGKVIFE